MVVLRLVGAVFAAVGGCAGWSEVVGVLAAVAAGGFVEASAVVEELAAVVAVVASAAAGGFVESSAVVGVLAAVTASAAVVAAGGFVEATAVVRELLEAVAVRAGGVLVLLVLSPSGS